jgi:hypothetical protein
MESKFFEIIVVTDLCTRTLHTVRASQVLSTDKHLRNSASANHVG